MAKKKKKASTVKRFKKTFYNENKKKMNIRKKLSRFFWCKKREYGKKNRTVACPFWDTFPSIGLLFGAIVWCIPWKLTEKTNKSYNSSRIYCIRDVEISFKKFSSETLHERCNWIVSRAKVSKRFNTDLWYSKYFCFRVGNMNMNSRPINKATEIAAI